MGRILIILLWKMTKIMLMAILTMTSFRRGSRGAGCFGGKITPSICGSNPPSWAGIDYDDNHNYNHHHNDDDHRHHDHLSRPIGGFPEDSFGVVVAIFATDLIDIEQLTIWLYVLFPTCPSASLVSILYVPSAPWIWCMINMMMMVMMVVMMM